MVTKDMLLFLKHALNHFESHPGQVYYVWFADDNRKQIKYTAMFNDWYFGKDAIAVYDHGVFCGTWAMDAIRAIDDEKIGPQPQKGA